MLVSLRPQFLPCQQRVLAKRLHLVFLYPEYSALDQKLDAQRITPLIHPKGNASRDPRQLSAANISGLSTTARRTRLVIRTFVSAPGDQLPPNPNRRTKSTIQV
jgi:hypothetical protein